VSTAEPKRSAPARYEEIAADIAGKIVARELKESERISGRSTLAATYRVSPETIRRAIALLHQRGIVQVQAGSGIRVISRNLAADYLDAVQTRSSLEKATLELQSLLSRRAALDAEITTAVTKVTTLTTRLGATMRELDEVELPADSWVVGQTLASARIRNVTGCTVVALIRGSAEEFSPSAETRLQAGDTLLLAGSEQARQRARQVLLEVRAPEGLA